MMKLWASASSATYDVPERIRKLAKDCICSQRDRYHYDIYGSKDAFQHLRDAVRKHEQEAIDVASAALLQKGSRDNESVLLGLELINYDFSKAFIRLCPSSASRISSGSVRMKDLADVVVAIATFQPEWAAGTLDLLHWLSEGSLESAVVSLCRDSDGSKLRFFLQKMEKGPEFVLDLCLRAHDVVALKGFRDKFQGAEYLQCCADGFLQSFPESVRRNNESTCSYSEPVQLVAPINAMLLAMTCGPLELSALLRMSVTQNRSAAVDFLLKVGAPAADILFELLAAKQFEQGKFLAVRLKACRFDSEMGKAFSRLLRDGHSSAAHVLLREEGFLLEKEICNLLSDPALGADTGTSIVTAFPKIAQNLFTALSNSSQAECSDEVLKSLCRCRAGIDWSKITDAGIRRLVDAGLIGIKTVKTSTDQQLVSRIVRCGFDVCGHLHELSVEEAANLVSRLLAQGDLSVGKLVAVARESRFPNSPSVVRLAALEEVVYAAASKPDKIALQNLVRHCPPATWTKVMEKTFNVGSSADATISVLKEAGCDVVQLVKDWGWGGSARYQRVVDALTKSGADMRQLLMDAVSQHDTIALAALKSGFPAATYYHHAMVILPAFEHFADPECAARVQLLLSGTSCRDVVVPGVCKLAEDKRGRLLLAALTWVDSQPRSSMQLVYDCLWSSCTRVFNVLAAGYSVSKFLKASSHLSPVARYRELIACGVDFTDHLIATAAREDGVEQVRLMRDAGLRLDQAIFKMVDRETDKAVEETVLRALVEVAQPVDLETALVLLSSYAGSARAAKARRMAKQIMIHSCRGQMFDVSAKALVQLLRDSKRDELKFIVSAGADVPRLLILIAQDPQSGELFRRVVSIFGVNVFQKTNYRGEPAVCILLSSGAYDSDPETLKRLLHAGCRADAVRNKDDVSALMLACGSGSVANVRVLLEALRGEGQGRLLDVLMAKAKRTLWTPLMFAANAGSVDIVQLLLEHGADAGQQNADGHTAAGIALQKKHNRVSVALDRHVRSLPPPTVFLGRARS